MIKWFIFLSSVVQCTCYTFKGNHGQGFPAWLDGTIEMDHKMALPSKSGFTVFRAMMIYYEAAMH